MRLIIFPPEYLLFVFQRAQITLKTQAVMAAYFCPALGTPPLLCFRLKKGLNAMLPDIVQISDHTHPVQGLITLIQLEQSPAGKIRAFIAVSYLTTAHKLAVFLDEGALFIPGSATCTVGHTDSLALSAVLESQIAGAQGTVHTARGDQFFLHIHRSINTT
jgi:hypothetical protein